MMRWDVAGFVGGSKPAAPIRWHVVGGNPLLPEQRAQVTAKLQGFLQQCRLSIAATQWANGELPDGSPYRLYWSQGSAEVSIAPRSVDTMKVLNYVAWPVIYEPGYVAPIFDRGVIQEVSDDLGYIIETGVFTNFSLDGNDFGFFQTSLRRDFFIGGLTFSHEETFQPTAWDEGAQGIHTVTGMFPGVSMAGFAPGYGGYDQSYSYYHQITKIEITADAVSIQTRTQTDTGGWVTGVYSTRIPRNPAAMGYFTDAMGDYWVGLCSGTVNTAVYPVVADIQVDVAGAVALCEAIIAEFEGGKPHPQLQAKRIAGRAVISAAVGKWCKAGLGDYHRNARILGFPYKTYFTPKDENLLQALLTGSISEEAVQRLNDKGIWKNKTTKSVSQAAHRMPGCPWSGGQRGAEFLALTGFRDGVVAASLSALKVVDNEFHVTEAQQYQVDSLESGKPLWMQNAQALGLERAAKDKGQPLVFDSQVPQGVALVVLHLEFEVFDPYTGLWLWIPVPGMVQFDAVWIADLGRYSYIPPAGEPAIRAVRAAGATRYRRTQQGWSQGTASAFADWQAPFASTNLNVPSAVAIAINLPEVGYPASSETDGVIWKGGPKDAAALRALPLADLFHICAHALKAAKVDKRL